MNHSYDCIVLGLGGVGSAAVAHLASSRHRVLGLDRFAPPHSHGSSHGQTRIIRKAYFEHPDYVPLLNRAYELWKELETDCGEHLYVPTGLLQAGPQEGEVISGVIRSASAHRLPIETMSMSEAESRYPGIGGDPSWQAILELDAGYLYVEKCVAAHLQIASMRGAKLLMNQPVLSWHSTGNQVTVVTDHDSYHSDSLIIAAGPWAAECLAKYRIPLRVLRKHLYWYPAKAEYHQRKGFPCFFYDTPSGYFYGFPDIFDNDSASESGLKIARHSGGFEVRSPEKGSHHLDEEDQSAVESFLELNLPGVGRPFNRWEGCYYTMTPDCHFIVDHLPDAPNVTVIAGLSGHGFKFTSVLGELAAQLALNQQTSLPIDLFQWR